MPKHLENHQNNAIYECAQQIWQQCFIEDNSLLFNGPLWTLQNMNALHSAFVLNPDESKDKDFYVKFKGQIGSSGQSVIRLAAELLCLYYLFPSPSSVSKEKKIENVNTVLEWNKDAIPSDSIVLKAFSCGIGGTGTAFNTLMYKELWWIIAILIDFKKRSTDERKSLSEPWAFANFLDSVPMDGNRQSRHTLPHLLFPIAFERIATRGDKEEIVKAFGEFISDSSISLDEQLFQIRQQLEKQYPGKQLDFYRPPLREQWKTEKPYPGGTLEKEFKTWFANQKKSDGKQYSPETMTQYINALKKAVQKLYGIEIEPTNLFCYKTLSEFVSVHATIKTAPNYAEVNSNFASGSFEAGMNRYKDFLAERAINGVIELQGVGVSQTVFTDDYIKTYFNGCFLKPERLHQMLTRLHSKKNLILQGPPGTGKTWIAKRLAQAFTGEKDSARIETMQFHATLSYEDFISGWRPTGKDGLELIDGPFLDCIKKAVENPAARHVMVIEEINRGNPAQIFGEMLTLLESDKRYPTESIRLCYQKKGERRTAYIPENLYLIGTMNIADRSLAIVDFALRRRFSFFDLYPAFNSHLWVDWMIENARLDPVFIKKIAENMKECNQKISEEVALGPQFVIGHSYFTTDKPVRNAADWFTDIVDTEILPLLREYWFDSQKTAEDIVDKLKSGVLA